MALVWTYFPTMRAALRAAELLDGPFTCSRVVNVLSPYYQTPWAVLVHLPSGLADYLEPGREALAIIDRVTFMFEGVRDSEIPDIHSPPTRKAVEQAVGSWLQRREADLSAPLFEMPGDTGVIG